ncbi:hypothetical protein [Paenibacillus sanguinis]|uniref:hypothetical protein n=1 Tax=Paenibacillus sanguinis TaxID=225906 RepID=UPI0003737F73|nr:hypothetical protein [Paenibacillus sanguinis]
MINYINEKQGPEFDESQFDWFLPGPPKPVLLLNVSKERGIYLNSKLCECVPKRITIAIKKDGVEILLKEMPEKGFQVLKNGKIKASELLEIIRRRGVSLPASYTVEEKENLWFAKLIPTITPLPSRKTPNKPRKNGLQDMISKKDQNDG